MITNDTQIEYRDTDHSYWKDGKRVVGISELLDYWGYIDKTHYSEAPRDRGTLIHDLIADACAGGQAFMGQEDQAIVGRIEAFLAFKQAKDFRPTKIEAIHYSPVANLACRIDLIGTFGTAPIPAIIEIKCGGKEGWHSLQTAGQALCAQLYNLRRFALYLKADGKFDLREHNKRIELGIVQGLAATYWYNQAEGLKLTNGGTK